MPPPTPLEVLQGAWEMVVSEKVEGSCTACVATLDQKLNQLSYANLGKQGEHKQEKKRRNQALASLEKVKEGDG